VTSTATNTRITHLGNVGVPVSDQDRSVEFWVEKLGFEKRMDVGFGDGHRWIEVAPSGAQTALALLPPGQETHTGIDTAVRFMTRDAEADHANLRSRGVDTDAEVMRLGGPVPPMFAFRDPDGNTFYIVEHSRAES
jgi:catechol 2,3-dioxygenase-like lactoylglutathione lyase family enzyme